jgi:hypothetical protein
MSGTGVGTLLLCETPANLEEAQMRFSAIQVNQERRYALERDTQTGTPVFSIPVSNRLADYSEYYTISEGELAHFLADEAAAAAFAGQCGRHEQDERLVLKPGTDRGVY